MYGCKSMPMSLRLKVKSNRNSIKINKKERKKWGLWGGTNDIIIVISGQFTNTFCHNKTL